MIAQQVRPFSERLRSRSWHDMSAELVRVAEA
jgi:hypothetical protein